MARTGRAGAAGRGARRALPLLALLAACARAPLAPPLPQGAPDPVLAGVARAADPGPRPGECWVSQPRRAVIETVTEHVRVAAERRDPSGAVTRPASYRTETQQRIVSEGGTDWFRALCPETLTAEFVTVLQRALAARQLYRGAPSGAIDGATTQAIRSFQRARGLDSGTLSWRAAEYLGLVVYEGAAGGTGEGAAEAGPPRP